MLVFVQDEKEKEVEHLIHYIKIQNEYTHFDIFSVDENSIVCIVISYRDF